MQWQIEIANKIRNKACLKNKNKTQKIKKLKKKLKREQRSLSRKYENKKKRGEKLLIETSRQVVGESINHPKKSANIEKNIIRVQKLHQELARKRKEYIRYVVNILVKTKPKYITIEDLNISGMLKNKHLSKAISQQNFYYFKEWLADRFYPSSKIKSDLKLSDRIYICDCGNRIDRDFQASINLERCAH